MLATTPYPPPPQNPQPSKMMNAWWINEPLMQTLDSYLAGVELAEGGVLLVCNPIKAPAATEEGGDGG